MLYFDSNNGLRWAVLGTKTASYAELKGYVSPVLVHGDGASGAGKHTFAAIAAALRNLILFHPIASFRYQYNMVDIKNHWIILIFDEIILISERENGIMEMKS